MKKGELWESNNHHYFIFITNSFQLKFLGQSEVKRVFYQRVGKDTESKPLFKERPIRQYYLDLRKDENLGSISHCMDYGVTQWRKTKHSLTKKRGN